MISRKMTEFTPFISLGSVSQATRHSEGVTVALLLAWNELQLRGPKCEVRILGSTQGFPILPGSCL